MAITTYAELQTAVANYMHRSDLTSRIPEFIALFEAYANRKLRVRQMETSTDLTPADGEVALPADYLAWRRATWAGDTRVELEYVHPSWLQAAYPTTPAGTPAHFTVEGSTLKVRPTSATTIEFDYYQKIPALSGTVNWLFSANPDIYLAGTLMEGFGYAQDLEAAMAWGARRDGMIAELEALDIATKGGAIRPIGMTII